MCWRVSRYYEALSTSEREELKSAREEAGRLGRGLQLDALGVEHARRASHPHSLSEPPALPLSASIAIMPGHSTTHPVYT